MKKKGFTLIELLVVVAIIGVLATVVLGALGSARAKARDARRLSDIKTIQTALEFYFLDNGKYPTTSWASSNSAAAWSGLETQLGVTLPKDPINDTYTTTSAGAIIGQYTYSYYASTSVTQCSGKAYMLVVNLESKADTSAGVYLCDATRGYGNSVVVGVDGYGNFIGPVL